MIKEVRFHIAATSPFGTSSGGMMFVPHWDPENVGYNPTGGAINIDKAVRQHDSALLRPRDSHVFIFNTDEQYRYTTYGSSTRLSSYGAVVGIVRDKAAIGDQARFTVTMTTTIQFVRTSYHIPTVKPVENIGIEVTGSDQGIDVTVTQGAVEAADSFVEFLTPLEIKVSYKRELLKGVNHSYSHRITSNSAFMKPIGDNKFRFEHNPKAYNLEENSKLTKIKVITHPKFAKFTIRNGKSTIKAFGGNPTRYMDAFFNTKSPFQGIN